MNKEMIDDRVARLEQEKAALLAALKDRNRDAMIIKLLIAAGHVREETVEKARELAMGID